MNLIVSETRIGICRPRDGSPSLGAEVCGELYRESRITRMSVAKIGATGATHYYHCCVVAFSPDSQTIDGRIWQDSRTQT